MGPFTIDHVQITVRPEDEAACLRFYRTVLQLTEIPKPEPLRNRGGAWFQVGSVQLHVSPEKVSEEQNQRSKRHVCFRTDDLAGIERRLREAGLEIIPDDRPIPEAIRFSIRDPGGNRVEILQPRSPA